MISSSLNAGGSAALRIGLIGYGKIGAIHGSHVHGAQQIAGVKLVGVAEVNPDLLSVAPPGVWKGSDYRELLALEGVDAVVISLPHHLHREATLAALQAGKHVFLEKPIAISHAEARELIACAQKVGRTLMVNMTHRFYPPMRKGRELLASGAIGKVVAVRDYYMEVIRREEFPKWFFDPAMAGGGVAVTDTIHLVDRIEWLLGERLTMVGAHGRRMDPQIEVEDCVEFLCRSDSGVPVSIGSFFCFEGPKDFSDGLTVFGTRGVLTIRAWSHLEWQTYGGEVIRYDGYPEGMEQARRAAVGHRAAMEEFVAALREGRPPVSEAREVVHAQEVVEAFYALHPQETFRHAASPAPVSTPALPETGEELAALRVINAVGYATRVGGSIPSPAVLEAMRRAQEGYFEIDDLLALASRRIAAATGSEAGLVTNGAAAALTLGAAAMLARFDLEAMEALPDTSGLERRELLYPVPESGDYDHPVRASGARLVPFSFGGEDDLEARLEKAITSRTAGVVFVWKHRSEGPLLARIGRVCREAGVPFLLDAAMALPPSGNLRGLMESGANLVALSGGKHLEGPQNSGLLFGDRDLVTSAWLQMVDLHVRPEAWSLRSLLEEGVIPRPPRHGIGRGFKIGKDVIAGCLAALEAYPKRDFAAERRRWIAVCEKLGTDLRPPADFCVEHLAENATGQYPVIRITASAPERMAAFKRDLKAGRPKIVTAEDDDHGAVAYLYPMTLSDADVETILHRCNDFFRS